MSNRNRHHSFAAPGTYQHSGDGYSNYGPPPTPPPPYGNPAFNSSQNPQWYNSQSNQSIAPYQQLHVPPPPLPSQSQAGFQEYNPAQYGASSAGASEQPPPALPPRPQNETPSPQYNWAHNAGHGVTPVPGGQRHNARPSQWSQPGGDRMYEGWHQHDYRQTQQDTNQRVDMNNAGALSPPILPPRPSSVHGQPSKPSNSPPNAANQAYTANQAYIEQSATNALPWGSTYQSPAATPFNSAIQQHYNSTAVPPQTSSSSVTPARPTSGETQHRPSLTSPQSPQAGAAIHSAGWFNPSGSIFPQFSQVAQPASLPQASPPLPAPPARPAASPSPRQNTPASNQQPSPPAQSNPVSPVERQQSYSSLYDAPRPGSYGAAHIVSRENSESSISGHRPLRKPAHQVADGYKSPSAASPPIRANKFAGHGDGSSGWERFPAASVAEADGTDAFARKNKDVIVKHANEMEIMELDSTPLPLPKPPSQATAGVDENPDIKPLERVETQVGITPIIESYGDRTPQEAERTQSPMSLDSKDRKGDPEQNRGERQGLASADIAPALDVWYKNSLMRYLSMLYKEQAAATVEEKRKIFQQFMAEEAKIRGLSRRLDQSRPLQAAQKPIAVGSPIAPEKKQQQRQHNPATIDTSAADVSVDSDDVEFSPGGRPIIRNLPTRSRDDKSLSTRAASQRPLVPNHVDASANKDAAQSDGTGADRLDISRAPNAQNSPAYVPFRAGTGINNGSAGPKPAIGSSESSAPKPSKDPSKPLYTPLYKRYKPTHTNSAGNTQPGSPPQPVRSGSAPDIRHDRSGSITDTSRRRSEHAESLLDRKAQPASAEAGEPARNDAAVDAANSSPVKDPEASTTDSSPIRRLEALVFNADRSASLNARLENLKTSVLLYPSDYTFVSAAFDKWKIKAAGARARGETDARGRASENEQHIGKLYDENQIQYSDIKHLEDTFKQQEAQIRSRLNEAEYESYLTDVFDPLYKRLQEEIGALTELLRDAKALATEEGVAGHEMKELFDDNWADKVDLAESLKVLVELHTKLEERQDQLSDCLIKRDRRRRAIDEIAVDGADKLAQVDFRKKLDVVERSATVAKCDAKKARIQPLWQMIKPAAMNGIKENNALVEEISKSLEDASATDELAESSQHASLKDQLLQTLQALSASSESLENSFYRIDVDLNLAEFNTAVAHATLDSVPKSVIANLAEEKATEDSTLNKDHDKRLELIHSALRNGQAGVEKAFRGKLAQAEHELRQQKALEAAKRRNASLRSALDVQTPI